MVQRVSSMYLRCGRQFVPVLPIVPRFAGSCCCTGARTGGGVVVRDVRFLRAQVTDIASEIVISEGVRAPHVGC